MEDEVATEVEAPIEEETTESNDTEEVNEAVELSTPVEGSDVEAPAPAPEVQQSEVVEEEDEEPLYNYAPVPQPQGFDFSQLPTDAEGNVAPEAFSQAMQQWQFQTMDAARQQARQEMMEMRKEERQWENVYKEFPAVKGNKDLFRAIQRQQAGFALEGKQATPIQAAKEVMKFVQSARETGVRQAQESVRIQQSARLETSSTQADVKASKTDDLFGQIASGDKRIAEAARKNLLAQWVREGKLNN